MWVNEMCEREFAFGAHTTKQHALSSKPKDLLAEVSGRELVLQCMREGVGVLMLKDSDRFTDHLLEVVERGW